MRLTNLHFAFAFAIASLGLFGVLGWVLDRPLLQGSYNDSVVPMQPATGAACIGWAWRWLLRCSGRTHGFVDGIVPTVLVFSLLGYIEPSSNPQTVGHNVPSLGTILAFLIALLPATRPVVAYLASLALIALVGHAMSLPWLYYYYPAYSTGMAVTTAAAVALIAGAKAYSLKYDGPRTKG